MSSPNDPAFELREILLANLRNGRWRAGEQLPTERQMCESYGIGRSTVRRVLQQLKQRGLVTQTVGSGTYAAEDIAQKLSNSEAREVHISPAELMEARMLFEPVVIDLVVQNGTSADFSEMEECCRRAETAETLEQFEYWDGSLHQKIADASHNTFVTSVFNLINKVRENGEWGKLKKKSLTPERRNAYEQDHRALVAALKERDAASARQAMREHLVRVRGNLFDY
jgi:DNA-binding FadR family transcriptional regulator